MSTIKSSDEHLTINADGSGKDIKLQNNGSESVAITSTGVGIGTSSPQSTFSVKVSDYRQLDVIKDSGDDHLVLKATSPGNSYNLRSIELAGTDVSFSTGASSGTSYTERMRILSSGGITFNGDTSSSNALDDYETGTFTPYFTGGGTCTYSHQAGRYVKIGKLVNIEIHIDISSVGTGAGNLVVGGMPFATGSTAGVLYANTSSTHGTSWTTTRNNINGLMGENSTVVGMYHNMASSSGAQIVSHADIGTGNLLFSMAYYTQ